MKYKYEYKTINAKEEKDGIINYDIEMPTDWKFVAIIPSRTLLFERIVEEPETFTEEQIKGRSNIKE